MEASGGPPRRVRARGGGFGLRTTGLRRPDPPEEEPDSGGRSQQQDEGGLSRWLGVQNVMHSTRLCEDEELQFKDLVRKLQLTEKETLLRLINYFTSSIEIETQPANAQFPPTSTQTDPAKSQGDDQAEIAARGRLFATVQESDETMATATSTVEDPRAPPGESAIAVDTCSPTRPPRGVGSSKIRRPPDCSSRQRSSIHRDMFCAEAKRSKLGTKKFGPLPKRPGHIRRSLQIELYEDQIERFKELRGWLGKNNAATLIYLMDTEELYQEQKRAQSVDTVATTSSTPQRIEVAVPTAIDQSPVAAKRALLTMSPISAARMVAATDGFVVGQGTGAVQENGGVPLEENNPHVGQDDHSDQMPTPPKKVPIYERATVPKINDDDEQAGPANVFDFDPEKEDYEYVDEDEMAVVQVAAENTHLDEIIDSCYRPDAWGRYLKNPRKPKENKMAANPETADSSQYDNSKCPRLLPDEYYLEWSEGKQCNLMLPKGDAPVFPSDVAKKPDTRSALDLVQSKRYIVEVAELLKLVSPKCYRSDCMEMNDFSKDGINHDGAACIITIRCMGPHRHKKVWYSSQKIQHQSKSQSTFYTINTLLPAAVILSGNQMGKINQFLKLLNIGGAASGLFAITQKCIIAPAITSAYEHMQKTMVDTLKAKKMKAVIASDGQYDSPGQWASYCTVTNMIVATIEKTDDGQEKVENSAYVASVDVVERRHCDKKSAKMEIAGFLLGLMQVAVTMGVEVKEVVTDQNISIVKLMAMANDDPDKFVETTTQILKNFKSFAQHGWSHTLLCMVCQEIKHSLDVWHRAKNIGYSLVKLNVPSKERKNYYQWIHKVKNHFFWVAQNAQGDEAKFRYDWLSLLKQCKTAQSASGPSQRSRKRDPNEPELLSSASKSFRNIEGVVTDPKLLRDIPYYVNFRHTSHLESFNSMTLTYAPKRYFFGWLGMVIRKYLAVLDWNNEVHKPILRDEEGEPVYYVKYNKRSDKRTALTKKAPNTRQHLPHLMALCLYERCVSQANLHAKPSEPSYEPIYANDPKHLPVAAFESKADVVRRYKQQTRMPGRLAMPDADDKDDDEGEQELAPQSEDTSEEESASERASCSDDVESASGRESVAGEEDTGSGEDTESGTTSVSEEYIPSDASLE